MKVDSRGSTVYFETWKWSIVGESFDRIGFVKIIRQKPGRKVSPSRVLKSIHRKSKSKLSLKQYARSIVNRKELINTNFEVASAWLKNKGI